MARLEGKVAAVTGGALGIGKAAVERMAEEGAAVGILDCLDSEGETLAKSLSDKGYKVGYWHCDVTNEQQVKAALDGVAGHFGALNVVVSNAGMSGANKPTHEVTEEEWDKVQAVNVKGVFFCTKHAIPHMKKAGGGSIVNLGSISWHLGLRDLTLYQTAKAAIEGMTRSLARELGRDGIRVNTILPGNVQTPRQMRWYTPEGEAEIVEAQCLDGRIQPCDIAAMAMFLASDDARFCTAHNYWVDAGWR